MPLQISWLGHATTEIRSGDQIILTDPVFSHRIFYLKRQTPLPIDPATIPAPSVVLISHAHYDHLDLPSFKYFPQTVPIVVPTGLKKLLSKFVRNEVIELDLEDSITLGSVKISSFPVRHHGFRILPFRYTRCNGYLIEVGGKRIFFPGDTAYRPDFAQWGSDADAALMPISCYKPEWFMKGRHINPEEAVRIFEELNARFLIPIHWGTFKLSTEPMEEPIEWLKRLAEEKGLTDRIRILQPGVSLTL